MTDKSVNNVGTTRGKPFQPGNPGRPKGAKNRRTQLLEAMAIKDGPAIMKKMIEGAKSGDMQAMKFVLERLFPVPKSRRLALAMPEAKDAAGIAEAFNSLMEALSAGDLFTDEAQAIAGILESRRRSIETADHEARLTAIEAAAELARNGR